MSMRTRVVTSMSTLLALLVGLIITPAALAADGVGTAGRVDDRYTTFFCFAVIAFFAVLVTVLSLIQGRLEAKKDQRRHDLERFNR